MASYFGRLSSFYFWYFAFIGAFAPFFSLYLQRRGFGTFEIALLLGISPALRIFVPFFWAWLADHLGTKHKLISGLAIATPILFSLVMIDGGFVFIASILIVWGLVWSGILPIAEALCVESLGNKLSVYGRIRLWGSIGFILVVVLGGYLFERTDVIHLDWLICIILLMLMCSVLMLPQDTETRVEANKTDSPQSFSVNRQICYLLVCFFVMQFAHGSYNAFFSIFLVENGYSKSTVGWLWAIAVTAEILIFLWMPRLFKRFTVNDFFLFCFLVAVARFTLVCIGYESLWILVLTQIMHAVTFGMFHVAGITATNSVFTGKYRSRGQALYSSVGFGAGGASGTFVAGFLWERIGGAATFGVSAVAGILGIILMLWVRKQGYKI